MLEKKVPLKLSLFYAPRGFLFDVENKELLTIFTKEIEKFIRATDGGAKSLLVRGGERMVKTAFGNSSDDEVENYAYDYYFVNDKALDEAKEEFIKFLKNII